MNIEDSNAFSQPIAELHPRGILLWAHAAMYCAAAFFALGGVLCFIFALAIPPFGVEKVIFFIPMSLFSLYVFRQFFCLALLWIRFKIAVCPEGIWYCIGWERRYIRWKEFIGISFQASLSKPGFYVASEETRNTLILAAETRGNPFEEKGNSVENSFSITGNLVEALGNPDDFLTAVKKQVDYKEEQAAFTEEEKRFHLLSLDDLGETMYLLRPRGFWTFVRIHFSRAIVYLFIVIFVGAVMGLIIDISEKAQFQPEKLHSALGESAASCIFLLAGCYYLRKLWLYARFWSCAKLYVCQKGFYYQTNSGNMAFLWSESAVEVFSDVKNHISYLVLRRSDGRSAIIDQETLNSFGAEIRSALEYMYQQLDKSKS